MRYVSKCIPKQMHLQPLPKNVGNERRVSEIVRQRVTGHRTGDGEARRPSVLRRCRGTRRWWRLEDRSRWRLATSDVGWQQFMRYWEPCLGDTGDTVVCTFARVSWFILIAPVPAQYWFPSQPISAKVVRALKVWTFRRLRLYTENRYVH